MVFNARWSMSGRDDDYFVNNQQQANHTMVAIHGCFFAMLNVEIAIDMNSLAEMNCFHG